jgi:hypothetical protein
MTGPGVSDSAAAVNLEFLQTYANITMQPRAVQSVNISEASINSGDFLGVIRLDGLDPVLAWAMGSHTGHTTVALRDPDSGQLYVTESTATSAYWERNGIQKTPFQDWLKDAEAADFQVVHAPLNAERAATFDSDQAWSYFESVEGLDYGYPNMLFGWLDTLQENYPCLPPDYSSTCLQFELVATLFGVLDRLTPSTMDLMWNQAWNHRLNTSGLRTAALYQEAVSQGLQPESVPKIVEQDSWLYTVKNNDGSLQQGASSVCSTYVCHAWKAGGLFNDFTDTVNCGEHANWGVYSLALFEDPAKRPKQCKQADPDNPTCQLLGKYSLVLNDYNSVAPYPYMHNNCPSEAPVYDRPNGC